jgi:hypothetical protein
MGEAEPRPVGEGGFFLPTVYEESKAMVTERLKQGEVLMVEGSKLSVADQFLAFVLQMEFLKFADASYPTRHRERRQSFPSGSW